MKTRSDDSFLLDILGAKLNLTTMRKVTLLCSILMSLYAANTYGQEIATDNKGEPLFSIPSSDVANTEIALKNIGVTLRPFKFQKKRFYVNEGGTKFYTMDKSTVLNIGGSLVDNDDDVFTISKDANITPHLEIGISRGIDELINPGKIKKYYTLSATVFADFQCFDLYDTVNKVFLPKYRRTSYGAQIGANMFFKTKFAIAFNLRYKNSIETDEQVNYQKKASNTIYVDNSIVTNGENDGFLSPLDPSKNWRVSLSFPWFLKTEKRQFALMPYYFISFGEGLTPKNNAGLILTMLNDKFRGFDDANTGNRDTDKKYSFDAAFSVGLNLLSTGTGNHPFIFLSGTFNLGPSGKAGKDTPKSKDKSLF